ncbi:MAG: superoxide dismutase [Alphaproteobacteria bacterium]
MPFQLMPLPYAKSALQPYMSAQTLDFHHGKHHKNYVDTLNKLIADTSLEKASLEEIIEETSEDQKKKNIFNNAAQVWNHDFFWQSMKPKGGGKPKGEIGSLIENAFGSFDDFKTEFKEAATTQFGSGWAWLVLDQNKLEIIKTGNAVNPLVAGQKALLTCDVWEHAYYLDYQNKRVDMVDAFLNHLINWDFVSENLNA